MPTRLPTRRPLWQRAARAPASLSATTRENLAATAAEFILALAFVAAVVAVLANMETIGATLVLPPGALVVALP